MNNTCQALARLCRYPDAHIRPDVHAMLAGLDGEVGRRIRAFLDATADVSVEDLQELYTAAFDFDPACALDVGWHLFGETHDRGAFLAALREAEERAGLPDTAELPDHLTRVLRLLGREESAEAAALAALVAPAIETVRRALGAAGSPYAHVLAAVETLVDGTAVEARPEVTQP